MNKTTRAHVAEITANVADWDNHLAELRDEADRTGNYTRYDELRADINENLADELRALLTTLTTE